MTTNGTRNASRLFWAAALLVACSSSSDGSEEQGSGGSSASGGRGVGGTTGAGGSLGTGGGAASGGSNAGGSSATGGAMGRGGRPATGGAPGTGGDPSTGGSIGTGGSRGTGGATGTGGAQGNGGAAGGRSGSGAGGRSGGGGTGMGGTGSGGVATGGVATGGRSGGGTGGGGTGGFDPCPTSGQCKIMPLGDSITDGTGYAGGYRVELFSKAIADKKNITFVGSLSNGPNTVSGVTFPKNHEGHFGWRIDQVDGLIPDPALNVAPHIVLVHLGTNDINQGQLSGASDRLGSLIDQIVADLPGSLVVVAKIIPEPSQASGINTLNAAIPGVVQTRANAGKHVILVDQFAGFPSSELGDGVHPNQAGYARMAGVWYEAIKSYLH